MASAANGNQELKKYNISPEELEERLNATGFGTVYIGFATFVPEQEKTREMINGSTSDATGGTSESTSGTGGVIFVDDGINSLNHFIGQGIVSLPVKEMSEKGGKGEDKKEQEADKNEEREEI